MTPIQNLSSISQKEEQSQKRHQSTKNAIQMLRVLVCRVFQTEASHEAPLAHSNCFAVSAWFGIFAILNVGQFDAMDMTMP